MKVVAFLTEYAVVDRIIRHLELTFVAEKPPPEIVFRPDLETKYGISGREFEIIALICQGKTNQEIADELCISVRTVKDHNYSIFQKTGVRNRTQLARLFMNRAGNGNPSV